MMAAAAEAGSAANIGFPRCGAELREARERLGWDLGEVAAALRIRLPYLQAIEDGRLSALPGNAYALGFLRTYSTALGLDADDMTRRFRLESADVNRRPELSFPAPVPERGVPTGAAILLGLVIAVVAYGAWYRYGDHAAAPTHSVPPVPVQLLPEHRTAAAVSPQVASVMPTTPGAPIQTPPTAKQAPPPSVAPSPAPVAQLPASGNSPVAPPVTANPAAPPTSPATAMPPPAQAVGATPGAQNAPASAVPATAPVPAAPAESGTVLVATEPSWVQVRRADGGVVFDHVLQAGEHWTVPPGEAGLLLTTGNAGGLAVSRNGVVGPVLGRTGAVLRRIALDGAAAAGTAGIAPGPSATLPATPPAVPPATVPVATSTLPSTQPRHLRPASALPAPSADDSADQLNARELHGGTPPSR